MAIKIGQSSRLKDIVEGIKWTFPQKYSFQFKEVLPRTEEELVEYPKRVPTLTHW